MLETERDDRDMSDDNILLQQVCEEHGVSAKQIGAAVGRSLPTVYRWLAGEATIPSVVWRWLFEKTGDLRIGSLFIGATPHVLAKIDLHPARTTPATLKQLIQTRKGQISCEELVLTILEDGKIDEADGTVIEHYKVAFPKMIEQQWALFHAVTEALEVRTS